MSKTSGLNFCLANSTDSDPEIEALIGRIGKTPSKLPQLHTLPPQAIRNARDQGDSIWGSFKISNVVEARVLKCLTGDILMQSFAPATVLSKIAESADLLITTDADTGHDSAINVRRTVWAFKRAPPMLPPSSGKNLPQAMWLSSRQGITIRSRNEWKKEEIITNKEVLR